METNNEKPNEKKLSKARSSASTAPLRIKSATLKRKSCYINQLVKSLDLALGRLKKSKLVHGEGGSRQPHPAQRTIDMFIDSRSNYESINESLISMNFSHYELMRNLSHCTSEGNFSCNSVRRLSHTDVHRRDEHLEKYFCSIESWRRYMDDSCTDVTDVRSST